MKKIDIALKMCSYISQIIENKVQKENNLMDFEIKNQKLLFQNKESNTLNLNSEKLKYVAFGDSISAGFDGFLEDDFPGKYINNEVEGISYPAYLAEIFNKNNDLDTFYNFSVSSSSLVDWINFWKGHKTDIIDTEFQKQGYDYNFALDKLQNANFITISLGAMDFFYQLFAEIFKTDLSKIEHQINQGYDAFELGEQIIVEKYHKITNSVTKNIIRLILEIQKINPKSQINLISYPIPFLGLKQIIDNHFFQNKLLNIQISILDKVISLINKNIQKIALENSINWVNLYNEEYWESNIDKFSSIYFDIHPSYLGYKKMAQDLYIKITTSNWTASLEKYGITKKYFESDSSSINFKIKAPTDLNKIFDNSCEKYLNSLNEFEKEKLKHTNYKNYATRLIQYKGWIKTNSLNFTNNFFSSEIYTILDPNKELLTLIAFYYTLEEFTEKTVNLLVKSNIVQNLINFLQEYFKDVKEKDNFSLKKFITDFNKQIFDFSNYKQILLLIFETEIFKKQKNNLLSIFTNIFCNALVNFESQILKLILNTIFKKINLSQDDKIQLKNDFGKSLFHDKDILKKIIKQHLEILSQLLEDITLQNDINTFVNLLSYLQKHSDKYQIEQILNQWLTFAANKPFIGFFSLVMFQITNMHKPIISLNQTENLILQILKILNKQKNIKKLNKMIFDYSIQISSRQKLNFKYKAKLLFFASNLFAQLSLKNKKILIISLISLKKAFKDIKNRE
ncbi:SGNH/GDSL hydrolase family protein [Mycoplasma buteonis]|uniref:SGNH/GDSL hydrolase family protein n=1 Tax=Mycoplasma buteonis TaxID=171280 RepID=UPI000559D17D|nr:SGNH/GDSL hydrolase family protein [Mycoplasma buteonis]